MFMYLTVDEWIAVISAVAILTSPLIALQVQRKLDRDRAHSDRKMAIFRKLMTTRATPMAPDHVEALNSIEVEFYTKKEGDDKAVLDAWRLFINHVMTPSGTGPDLTRWTGTKVDKLVALLLKMSKSVGFPMDEAAIRTNIYHPSGFDYIEAEQHGLRKAILETFSGQRPLQTTVIGPVQVAAPLPAWGTVGAAAPTAAPNNPPALLPPAASGTP